jgi:catechol 2,3-dioxygenase-like lactoylglutathione lyase family enzyme
MLSSLRISQIYVLDQDQAVDFYVGKLGLEINTDQDLGFMRFLTVNVPGEPDRQILLEKPGPPAMDQNTADEVRELLTKGRTGGHLFFTTSDCRKAYDDLRGKGIEFTQEPTEQPYGIDFGLRDPFGNHIRVAQMSPVAQAAGRAEGHTTASHGGE